MDEFNIVTDTASIAFYDVNALKHRLNDDADWWDLEEDLIQDINLGNIGFCGLSSDGAYRIILVLSGTDKFDLSYNLTLTSGRFFIGPGEEITGAGFDPDNSKNNCGKIFELEEGYVRVLVKKDENIISIFVVPSTSGTNAFDEDVDLNLP